MSWIRVIGVDGHGAIIPGVRDIPMARLVPPDSLGARRARGLLLGEGTVRELFDRHPMHLPELGATLDGCPLCASSGVVVVDVPCSDPQCGDSTWDHPCDSRFERAACVCRDGVLLASAVREQLFQPDLDFPFDGPPS